MTSSMSSTMPVGFETALAALKVAPPAGVKSSEDIEATAKDFEAVFISQMLSHMFEGIETDPQFGGGPAEDVFRSMLVDEYGKNIAKAGGLGLSGQIKDMMIRLQAQQGE